MIDTSVHQTERRDVNVTPENLHGQKSARLHRRGDTQSIAQNHWQPVRGDHDRRVLQTTMTSTIHKEEHNKYRIHLVQSLDLTEEYTCILGTRHWHTICKQVFKAHYRFLGLKNLTTTAYQPRRMRKLENVIGQHDGNRKNR